MKSLRSILHESILGVDGPKMFDEGAIGDVYVALEKLPKARIEAYGRICYNENDINKFSKNITVNIEDGEYFRKLIDVINQHKTGLAFFGRKIPWFFACWDEKTSLVVRYEDMPIQNEKDYNTVIKSKMMTRGVYGGVVDPDNFPTFETWSFKLESKDYRGYGSLTDDYSWRDGWFFECNPDMKLIEKILDSKR